MKLTIDTDENLNAEQLYGLYVAAKAKNICNYFEDLKFAPEKEINTFDNAKIVSMVYKNGNAEEP